MKIPYVKIYTADLLAKSRRLSAEQIGNAVIGLCEQAFENETAYQPQTEPERAFFNMLLDWKNESVASLKQKKLAGKKGGKATQQKYKLSDESTACLSASSTLIKQTETDTETEYKRLTGAAKATQKPTPTPKPKLNPNPKQNSLQEFSNQVIAEFEDLQTDAQKAIWFKRNSRCLSDILNFCGKDIPLAIETIRICAEKLAKAGYEGGYEAVCRNLSTYHRVALERLKLKGVNYAQ